MKEEDFEETDEVLNREQEAGSALINR